MAGNAAAVEPEIYGPHEQAPRSDALVCDECDPPKAFKTKSGLTTHTRIVHRGLRVVTGGQREKRKPGRPPKADGAAPSTKGEKRPQRPPRGRASLVDLATGAWNGLAFVFTQRGNVPMGRAFRLQADAAGPAVDELVRGTIVDKVLQPIARTSDKGKAVFGLVGLPLAVAAFEKNPSDLTQRGVEAALMASLPSMVKAAKRAKAEQEELEANLSELAPMFDLPEGTPLTMADLMGWLFPVPPDAPTTEGKQ